MKSPFTLIRAQHVPDYDGRSLTCTNCHENVRVYEIPQGHLNPFEYVCGICCLPPFTSGKPRLSVLGGQA